MYGIAVNGGNRGMTIITENKQCSYKNVKGGYIHDRGVYKLDWLYEDQIVKGNPFVTRPVMIKDLEYVFNIWHRIGDVVKIGESEVIAVNDFLNLYAFGVDGEVAEIIVPASARIYIKSVYKHLYPIVTLEDLSSHIKVVSDDMELVVNMLAQHVVTRRVSLFSNGVKANAERYENNMKMLDTMVFRVYNHAVVSVDNSEFYRREHGEEVADIRYFVKHSNNRLSQCNISDGFELTSEFEIADVKDFMSKYGIAFESDKNLLTTKFSGRSEIYDTEYSVLFYSAYWFSMELLKNSALSGLIELSQESYNKNIKAFAKVVSDRHPDEVKNFIFKDWQFSM